MGSLKEEGGPAVDDDLDLDFGDDDSGKPGPTLH
jgi:hypothetical protein